MNKKAFQQINRNEKKNIRHLLQTLEISIPAGGNINILKDGLPIVDQVYSAIYKHGAGCQKRIIAFKDGTCWDDKNNPGADVDILDHDGGYK